VLYLLTDEKGTRPLKTRAEVERDLQALASADLTPEVNQLDLVFKIFVDSGLVVLLKEFPADRYQLVHDYLAEFIRQQQEPKLNQLMAELEAERKQRKLSDEKLNQFLRRGLRSSVAAMFVLVVLTGFAVKSALDANQQKKRAENSAWEATQQKTRAENKEIEALSNSSEALFASNRTFDALIESLKAGGRLKQIEQTNSATADLKIQVRGTLQQAVYDLREGNRSEVYSRMRERNSLEGHSSYVTSVSFSPDGKTIASGSSDNTIKLWNLEGKLLKTLSGHSSYVTSVSFSPDGKTIASGSWDNTVILWNLDLNDLLKQGCSWLNDYLATHPEPLEELKDCQTPSLLVKAAQSLVAQGEELARIDNTKDAVAKFRKALKWNPKLNFDPEAKAKQHLNEASDLVEKGKDLVQKGKVKEAISAYTQAQTIAPNVEISADSWNSLCKYGGPRGYAADVMFACEKAVALAPDDGDIRGSRGVARALTGNTKGAIEDFQAFIAKTEDKELKARRQPWVNALRAGKNPFTPEDIESLLK
jgi:tetratricopeptide (TPR) repeat protein